MEFEEQNNSAPQEHSNEYKYHAFISYRHADNKEQGRQWATWLHQAIETYEVPNDLVGKKNAHGSTIPARIYPIFRDEDELPAHADLGASIVSALEQTNLLIVLCSPRAVASTYVAEEIDYFKKLGHSDRIIAAMIDGEPNSSWDEGKQTSGFSKEDECFPLPLQFEYNTDGKPTDKRAEPIAADFRVNNNGKPEQGFTTPAAYREYLNSITLDNEAKLDSGTIDKQVKAYQKQLHLMLLKIIAGILGVPLGDLTQRDKAYQLELEKLKAKKLRRWLSTVALLAIVAICTGLFAYFQKENAQKQEKLAVEARQVMLEEKSRAVVAEENAIKEQVIAEQKRQEALLFESSALAKQANIEVQKGHADKAVLLTLNALPGIYGGERPWSHIAESALYNAQYNQSKIAVLDGKPSLCVDFQNKGTLFLQCKGSQIELREDNSGDISYQLKLEEQVLDAKFSPNDKFILAKNEREVFLWDLATKNIVYKYPHQSKNIQPLFSPSSEKILTVIDGKELALWSTLTGELIEKLKIPNQVVNIQFINEDIYTVATTRSFSYFHVGIGKADTYKFNSEISSFNKAPTGSLALTIANGKVELWNTIDGKSYVIPSKTQSDFAKEAYFSPDGSQILITYPYDLIAELWVTPTWKPFQKPVFSKQSRSIPLTHKDDLNPVFSEDSRLLAVASADFSDDTVIYDTQFGLRKILTIPQTGFMSSASFNSDGSKLISNAVGSEASLWNITKPKFHIVGKPLRDVAFTEDNLIVSHRDGIQIIDLDSFKVSKNLDSRFLMNATISKDEKVMISESDAHIVLWDLASYRNIKNKLETVGSDALHTLWSLGHAAPSISSNSQMMAFNSSPQKVSVVNFYTGEALLGVKNGGIIKRIRFALNDTRLIVLVNHPGDTNDTDTILVWDINNKKLAHTIELNSSVNDLVVSPDSQNIALSLRNKELVIIEVSSADEVFRKQLNESVNRIAYHPSGKSLVATSLSKQASSIELRNGSIEQLYSLRAPSFLTKFNEEGSLILFKSARFVEVFNASTGHKLLEFENQSEIEGDAFQFANFNRDGTKLMTASKSGIVTLMKLPPLEKELISFAIETLPNGRTCLTPKERKEFGLPLLNQAQKKLRKCQYE